MFSPDPVVDLTLQPVDQPNNSSVNTLRVLTWTSSSLSIIGSLLIIYIYLRHRKRLLFTVRLLFFLSIADLFAALSHFLHLAPTRVPIPPHFACQAQAHMQQFFFLSSYFWTLCFAINRYVQVVKRYPTVSKFEAFYHVLGWVLPAILAASVYLFGKDAYGPTDLWCWIRPQYTDARWLTFYGPMLLVIVEIMALSCMSLVALSSQREIERGAYGFDSTRFTVAGKVQIELFAYLIVFLLIRVPSVVHRIRDIAGYKHPVYTLELLHALASPLQGFLNFCLFFSNRSVRAHLRTQTRGGKGSDQGTNSGSAESDLSDERTLLSIDSFAFDTFPSHLKTDDIVNVYTCTWNMSDRQPPPMSVLKSFIPRVGYDVYAIGVQECSYKPIDDRATCEEEWFGLITKCLAGKCTPVATVSLGGIRLIVLIRDDLRQQVCHVHTCAEGTGLANVGSNKGGVGVSMMIGGFSLCFINVHLAALEGQKEERNKDMVQILRHFNNAFGVTDVTSEFHALFLLGDLNYRIDMPRRKIVSLINTEQWETLTEKDELTALRLSKQLYNGFREGGLFFPPTYKYEIGMHTYDLRKRSPAWCDRILFKTRPSVRVQQTYYTQAQNVTTSDHKPVRSSFRIGYPQLRRASPLPFVVVDASDLSNDEKSMPEDTVAAPSMSDSTVCAPSSEGGSQHVLKWILKFDVINVVGASSSRQVPLISPALSFHSPCIHEQPPLALGRRVNDKSNHFEWSERSLPQLKVNSQWSEADLERACVTIKITENELSGDDDLVGCCTFELADLFNRRDAKALSFEAQVNIDSRYNGYVVGEVSLQKLD